ncbi:unnamed protein product, partial [Lymnaea stagnalis]
MENNKSVVQAGGTDLALISDETLQTLIFIDFVVLSGAVSVLGIAFNIINIIVFNRLGFKETTNISLMSLALADLFVLMMMVGYSVIYNPLLVAAVQNHELVEALDYLAVGWPLLCFSRVSGCLTAFINFERFLCVALPLKVRVIISSRRTIAVSVGIITVVIACTLPAFYATGIGPRFSEALNRTNVGLYFKPDGRLLENVYLSINVFFQLASFASVVIFTIGLIHQFWKKTKKRNLLAWSSGAKSPALSARDKRMVKLVVLISAVFIGCSLPGVAGIIAMFFTGEYSSTGRYKNLFFASFSAFFLLGALNCSVTIFIYLKMSSKYRLVFQSLFK